MWVINIVDGFSKGRGLVSVLNIGIAGIGTTCVCEYYLGKHRCYNIIQYMQYTCKYLPAICIYYHELQGVIVSAIKWCNNIVLIMELFINIIYHVWCQRGDQFNVRYSLFQKTPSI